MGMRVFLTGASGYLGSVLARRLAELPEVDSITGVYNSTTPAAPSPPKVEYVKLDLRSPDMARAMVGHDVVVHSAFIVLWRAGMPAHTRTDICVNGACNVANAAVSNRVRRFVYASSVAVYGGALTRGQSGVGEDAPLGKGDAPLYYFNDKAAAEKLISEIVGPSGITLTLFRPTYITGPTDHASVKSFRDNATRFPGQDPRMQFVHEDDVASAFTQAVRADMPGAYNVVPDDYVRYSEMLRLIGVESPRTVPVGLARLVMHIRWRYLGSSTHPAWLHPMLGDVTFSNKKLRATGWAPRYTCADALRAAP